MIRRILTFFRIPLSTQLLVVQAVFLLPFCQLCIRLFHFKRLIKFFRLEPIQDPPSSQPAASEAAELIHWVILKTKTLPYPLKPRCLAQALTARTLLYQKGEKPILTLGASMSDSKLSAHAWLLCGSLVVTGEEEMNHCKKIASYL
jgi:hypothetical protein